MWTLNSSRRSERPGSDASALGDSPSRTTGQRFWVQALPCPMFLPRPEPRFLHLSRGNIGSTSRTAWHPAPVISRIPWPSHWVATWWCVVVRGTLPPCRPQGQEGHCLPACSTLRGLLMRTRAGAWKRRASWPSRAVSPTLCCRGSKEGLRWHSWGSGSERLPCAPVGLGRGACGLLRDMAMGERIVRGWASLF